MATERSRHVSSTHLLQRIAAGGGEIANTPCTIERLRAGIVTNVRLEAERQLEMRPSTKTTFDGFDGPGARLLRSPNSISIAWSEPPAIPEPDIDGRCEAPGILELDIDGPSEAPGILELDIRYRVSGS